MDPRLPHPPAGDALARKTLRHDIPDRHRQQRVEQELDHPRCRQLAFGQQRPNEQDRADETGQDPDDAQVQMLGPCDVEVEPAFQQRRIDVLQRNQQAEADLEREQHQHQHEEAHAQALGLVLDHCASPDRVRR
jgi:hypothetical protein